MRYLDINYKDYKSNDKCLNLLTIEFIERYNCISYTIVDDEMIVLVNEKFNLFNLNKLSFYTKLSIILIELGMDEWNKVFKLIKISNSKADAVYKYQMNKDDGYVSSLKEESVTFYESEIGNAPIVRLVDTLISEAIELNASDIHIEPNDKEIIIRFRIDGKLVYNSSLPLESLAEISTRLKVISNLDITKKFLPQDGKLKFNIDKNEYDVRVSILPTIYGERFSLRILYLSNKTFTIDTLQFSKIALGNVNKLINQANGLILVVGPTGSGKSTTLQTFLIKNKERGENIITVEDPVEYTIDGINQVQVNEESGLTFSKCLRSILRQDPNIIMVGEIRDVETAKIACQASITGHLVYSTLHTNDSYGVINRLLDMGVEKYLILDALKGIISQRLIRVLCDNCKKQVLIGEEDSKFLGVEPTQKIFKACGCNFCNYTGYLGRRAIYEVVCIDDDYRKLISDNLTYNKFARLMKKKKQESLFENAKSLALDGVTTIEEIKSIINL